MLIWEVNVVRPFCPSVAAYLDGIASSARHTEEALHEMELVVLLQMLPTGDTSSHPAVGTLQID